VATTFVAGVEAIRKGLAEPIGSLTQMGTIRVGKRTDGTSPKINEFVSLAGLNDLVFTGWDIFEDDMYTAASKAGVLDQRLLDKIKPFLSKIKPQKAAFDRNYVKMLDGPNVKKARTRWIWRSNCARISASSRRSPGPSGWSPSGAFDGNLPQAQQGS